MIKKRILLLEDNDDVAASTLESLQSNYHITYVKNLIDFHELVLEDLTENQKEKYYCFLIDLQLDDPHIPLSLYKEVIPNMFINNAKSQQNSLDMFQTKLLGWDYFEYIMRDEYYKNIRSRVVLLTGYYGLLSKSGVLDKYKNVKIINKNGNSYKSIVEMLETI